MNEQNSNQTMDAIHVKNYMEDEQIDSIIFEEIKGDNPYIKAIVYRDGVKHEINVVSISENEVIDLTD